MRMHKAAIAAARRSFFSSKRLGFLVGTVSCGVFGIILLLGSTSHSTICEDPSQPESQQSQTNSCSQKTSLLSGFRWIPRKTWLQEEERTVITTYYTRVPTTDMTVEADELLLDTWKTAWYDAGWQPRIVTNDDAKTHQEYDSLIKLATDPELVGPYSMACYLRWIAMAAVGGGWMADYDVFPLSPFKGHPLPNGGALTIYDGFVPSLVSGSAEEFLRLAKEIGDSLHRHVHFNKWNNMHSPDKNQMQHTLWSDVHSLKLLKAKHPDIFQSRKDVLHGEEALTKKDFTSEGDCHVADGKRVVHFSHRSMTKGENSKGAIQRAAVATEWLGKWRKQCKSTPIDE